MTARLTAALLAVITAVSYGRNEREKIFSFGHSAERPLTAESAIFRPQEALTVEIMVFRYG